jgi:hypothetical protein
VIGATTLANGKASQWFTTCAGIRRTETPEDLTALVRAERGYAPEFVYVSAVPELAAQILAIQDLPALSIM